MEKSEKIRILQDVIQIKSVNGNEKLVADYYKNLLEEHGIESAFIPYSEDRVSLVAELKGGETGKVLAFNGHTDVVDAGNLEEWTYPPFEGKIVDEKMYGRGTTDMKAGLTALAIAMIELKESKEPFKGTLKFVANMGEEMGMLGSEQLVNEGYVDDVDAFIIAEPTGSEAVVTSSKGSLQYEIISRGKTAHSSTPEVGINSILQLNHYMTVFNDKFEEAIQGIDNEKLGIPVNVFSVIHGGEQINSVPHKTVLQGNARTIPEFDNNETLNIIYEAVSETNSVIEGSIELNILQNNFTADSDAESDLVHAIRKASGKEIPTIGLPAATDASNYIRTPKDIEMAIYGPGSMALAHTIDEYVEIDDYLEFIDIFHKTALEYLNS